MTMTKIPSRKTWYTYVARVAKCQGSGGGLPWYFATLSTPGLPPATHATLVLCYSGDSRAGVAKVGHGPLIFLFCSCWLLKPLHISRAACCKSIACKSLAVDATARSYNQSLL